MPFNEVQRLWWNMTADHRLCHHDRLLWSCVGETNEDLRLIGAAKSFDGPGFPAHPQQSIVPLLAARASCGPTHDLNERPITSLLVHFTLF